MNSKTVTSVFALYAVVTNNAPAMARLRETNCDAAPDDTGTAGAAVPISFAGGKTTLSIVWTRPLLQARSALVTEAPPNFTAVPVLVTVTLKPCNVLGVCDATRALDAILLPITWYFKISARSVLANNSAFVIDRAVSAAVKAALVGANTVNGPVPLKAVTNSALMRASTRMLKSGVA